MLLTLVTSKISNNGEWRHFNIACNHKMIFYFIHDSANHNDEYYQRNNDKQQYKQFCCVLSMIKNVRMKENLSTWYFLKMMFRKQQLLKNKMPCTMRGCKNKRFYFALVIGYCDCNFSPQTVKFMFVDKSYHFFLLFHLIL